jgi:predicted HTH domain antitoxin
MAGSTEIPAYLLLQANAEVKRWDALKSTHEHLVLARKLVSELEEKRADAIIAVREHDQVSLKDIARLCGIKPNRVSEIISNRKFELGD